MNDNRKAIIQMRDIRKSFQMTKTESLEVLHGISLDIHEGEFVAIVGESGSGKSTLMNIIGALDRPTSGEYTLNDTVLSTLNDRQISTIRNQEIGFVFQSFNLIARTPAIKNVALPMLYAGKGRKEAYAKAKEYLELMGMGDRLNHHTNELSGGQNQRVAIARSMINNPSMILADEPTGALDSKTGRHIMDLFHKLHQEQGKTIILITHSQKLAQECQRVITLRDGEIISEARGEDARC